MLLPTNFCNFLTQCHISSPQFMPHDIFHIFLSCYKITSYCSFTLNFKSYFGRQIHLEIFFKAVNIYLNFNISPLSAWNHLFFSRQILENTKKYLNTPYWCWSFMRQISEMSFGESSTKLFSGSKIFDDYKDEFFTVFYFHLHHVIINSLYFFFFFNLISVIGQQAIFQNSCSPYLLMTDLRSSCNLLSPITSQL